MMPHHLQYSEAVETVLAAFKFDMTGSPRDDIDAMVEIIVSINCALDLLGFEHEKFGELGLALAARPETFRAFDAARRLGASTSDMQSILLRGLFSEAAR